MYHAVTPHCRIALCATEPGAGSAWAEPPASTVTCRVCLRRLARLRSVGRRRFRYPEAEAAAPGGGEGGS